MPLTDMPLRRGENIKLDCAVVDALNATLAGSTEHPALGALFLGPEGLGLRALLLVELCRGSPGSARTSLFTTKMVEMPPREFLGDCARAFLLSLIT